MLLSVPQNAPVSLIGDLLRLLAREFGVQGLSIARHPCLVLYAYDVTTGVVVDIGDRLNIVPIIDGTLGDLLPFALSMLWLHIWQFSGYVVQNAICSLPYGSAHISESLREKLSERNAGLYAFISVVERYILRYVMEQVSRAVIGSKIST